MITKLKYYKIVYDYKIEMLQNRLWLQNGNITKVEMTL